MTITPLNQVIDYIKHYNERFDFFTNKGKIRRGFRIYLECVKVPWMTDISIRPGTAKGWDGIIVTEGIKLYGIYFFKDKKEIDELNEEKYNKIVSSILKQYKDQLLNDNLQKIEQDFV